MEDTVGIKIDTTLIPRLEARILCAAFLEAVLRFYENPANVAGFERRLTEREGGIADGQADRASAPAGVSESYAAAGGGAAVGRI